MIFRRGSFALIKFTTRGNGKEERYGERERQGVFPAGNKKVKKRDGG